MTMCWETDAHARPTFEAIIQGLLELCENDMADQATIDVDGDDIEQHTYHDFTNGCTEVPRLFSSSSSTELLESRRQSPIEPPNARLSNWNPNNAMQRMTRPSSSLAHVQHGWSSAPEPRTTAPFSAFGSETPLFVAKMPPRLHTDGASRELATVVEEPKLPLALPIADAISQQARRVTLMTPPLSYETDV